MIPDAIEALAGWKKWFPYRQPAGHLLRAAYPALWVRFHSLPASKQYPENDLAWETILQRHNCVLRELAGHDEHLLLLTTGYSESLTPPVRDDELSAVDPRARWWHTFPVDPLDDTSYWHVFASTRTWTKGELDPVVRLVAEDIVGNVLIVPLDGRWVLHPYPGGMDVILASSEERNTIKNRHLEWLSAREDGL